MEILDVLSKPIRDFSITKAELRPYTLYNNTTLNYSDTIRIPVQNENAVIWPHGSFLQINGKISNIAPNTVQSIRLIKNFLSFLFTEIRCEINGVEVDQTKNLGITTTIKNYLTLTPSKNKHATSYAWFDSDYKLSKDGQFSFSLPLKNLLGIFEDYQKAIIHAKLELILIRSANDNDTVQQAAATSVTITLDKISWYIPHLEIDNLHKLKLLKVLERQQNILVPFRTWEIHSFPETTFSRSHTWQVKTSNVAQRPLYVIVGFHKGRRNTISQDPSVFDPTNLQNVKLFMNSTQYPYGDLNIDYSNNIYSIVYHMFANFKQSYYGPEKENEEIISMSDFKEKSPLIVFDTSKYVNDVKMGGTIDIKLEFTWHDAQVENITIYCLLLRDSMIQYNPFNSIVERVY